VIVRERRAADLFILCQRQLPQLRNTVMATINGTQVAMAPPEGYQVDFDNPQRNMMAANYIVYAVGLILSAMFLGQKLFVKIHIQRGLGVEDCMLPECLLNLQKLTLTLQILLL
jgi:hypothetical protein